MRCAAYRYSTLCALAVAVIMLCAAPVTRADGDIRDLKLFEYWDGGKIRKCTVFDVEGYLKTKAYCRTDGSVEKLERFDKHGNRTEAAFFDQKGMLQKGIDGWAASRWEYIDYQLASETRFDEDGSPIERKYYSESGRLLMRRYRDDDGFNPYESASMALRLGPRNVSSYAADPATDR